MPKGTVIKLHPELIGTHNWAISFHRGSKEINLTDYRIYGWFQAGIAYKANGEARIRIANLCKDAKVLLTRLRYAPGTFC
jgi:hypothetical protein